MSGVIKLSSPATRGFWEIPVLFEDDQLLALDKPSGLLTSPDPDDAQSPSLMKLLHTAIADGKPWAKERGLDYLNDTHQLERDTTGVLLLAKNKEAFVKVTDWFGAEKPAKQFLALVHGSPAADKFDVNAKLGSQPDRPGFVRVDPENGKKSKSSFEVVERFSGFTLLKCVLLTDRPQQIRVHLQNSGLRVVGDELYGGAPLLLSKLKRDFYLKRGKVERPLISAPALHCQQLNLPHPITEETMTITSPMSKDLTVALKYLRLYSA
jgi:RluA family pseudouridine synthase